MTSAHQDSSTDEAHRQAPEQHQQQPQGEHAGQGSDSAMRQMQVWEQNRASHSGGSRRQGPD